MGYRVNISKVLLSCTLLFVLLISGQEVVQAQNWSSFHKHANKHRKKKYIRGRSNPGKQCYELATKKWIHPLRLFKKKVKYEDVAPRPRTTTPHYASIKPTPMEKENTIPDIPLDTGDEVLALNNIPEPKSEKHKKIREQVLQEIKTDEDEGPKKLAPLYFTFDEDEFSVVDMDPFLIAVEYALQGKMILIEGHTDSRGNDNYNVDLSIKRVEKIRQLMQDMGVPDDRISVVGYGEEIAAHDNTTHEGRQLNRRVDFTAF